MVQYLVTETVNLADEKRYGIPGSHLVIRKILVMVINPFQGDVLRTRTDTERDHGGEIGRKGTQTELPGHARLVGKSDLRSAVAGLVVVHQDDVML